MSEAILSNGNTVLKALKANKLATSRTIQVNLGSTSSASFDGSANITPGVTGVLPVSKGGTGYTSLSNLKSALGIDSSSSGYTIIASEINGTLANMTRTYKVSGWQNYSIICVDITTPSGYDYAVKCNGKSGSFSYNGYDVDYGYISRLREGKSRLIFFPMHSAESIVSCIQIYSNLGIGCISVLSYNDLKTIEITPIGAVAFYSDIPVTITAIK